MEINDSILNALLESSTALQYAVAAGLPVQRMYTMADTAKYLGIHPRTLYNEVKAGRLKPFAPSGSRNRRFDVREVDRWIEEGSR